ncbi:MAG TPA: choice-of-anchor tandem repeat GloVer-containing protein [Candidatus Binatia bacterium]|nr:choice-of-anchor tandem repeat GloVer-containing protein [Candidatus Binatia bacterium]
MVRIQVRSWLVFSLVLFMGITPKLACAASAVPIYSFTPLWNGAYPSGGLIADSSGNLFGVTANGGIFGYGTVFEFIHDGDGKWTEQVLYNFDGLSDGSDPEAGLISDTQGNLYGTTVFGGAGNGTVFELMHLPGVGWEEKTLYSLPNGQNLGHGESGLAFDQNGNLFWASADPGSGPGAIYELSPQKDGQWKPTVVFQFSSTGAGGNTPQGPLVIDSAGNIFGTANMGGTGCSSPGCGVAFELSPTAGGIWKETVIHQFGGGTDGKYPASLIADAAGNLYGTTFDGGSGQGASCYGCGTVFELSPGNGQWTETILYNFQGNNDGANPAFPLLFDRAGNLYSATYGGGDLGYCDYGGCGTVFQLTPRGNGVWSESVLWRFNGGAEAYNQPSSGILATADGQLYGETINGETYGQNGSLFALNKASGEWKLSNISGFTASDGQTPFTGLVADSRGNLYGTTAGGGTADLGAVYELSPGAGGGWLEQMIYSFDSGGRRRCCVANSEASQLIVDSAGNLYGETRGGGNLGGGEAYELSLGVTGTWTEKTLYEFPGGAAGNSPTGGLVMDADGNLYGVTEFGGIDSIQGQGLSGHGVVFELTPTPTGWSEKAIYKFAGHPNDGTHPQGGLILDSAGNLYGTTSGGGDGDCSDKNGRVVGCGTVFRLTAQDGTWSETVIHSFLGGQQDGAYPSAALTLDHAGNLYGATPQGSPGQPCGDPCGTVFELSPDGSGGWSESFLFTFPDSTGAGYPLGNLILDSAGNLYGTASTTKGVNAVVGSVFKLAPNSSQGWVYTNLGSSGGSSYAGLIFGPYGHLYGTTWNEGATNSGTVFAIAP